MERKGNTFTPFPPLPRTMASTTPLTLEFDLHGDCDSPMDNAMELVRAANVCLSDDTCTILSADIGPHGFHRVTLAVQRWITAEKLAAAYIGAAWVPFDDELRQVAMAATVL